jgi:hypothetical protein
MICQHERLTHFNNHIAITLNLAKQGGENQLVFHHVNTNVHKVDIMD